MNGGIVRLVFTCDQSSCASVLSDVELGLVSGLELVLGLGLGLGHERSHRATGLHMRPVFMCVSAFGR